MNKALFFMVQSLLVTALVLGYNLASPAPAALANAPLTDSDFTDSDFARIATYIEAEMKAHHIPGLALAIVQGDRVVHLHGFGVANPNGEAVTGETPFILGSVSKSFTAMAVMQLVDAGQIDLDGSVQRYLPWFHVADEAASAAITVRHLLNQTSGIAETTGLNNATSHDISDGALEAQVRGFSTARLNHPAGEVFEYSSANYDILGLIVQTVSGQAYGSYIREHIFLPLEMTHAFTSDTEAMAQGLATGHRFWFGRPLPFVAPYTRANQPSGFLIAGAEDMAHYLIAYLNNGTYAGKSVLSPTGVAAMHQRPLHDEGESYYGMGWFVGEVDGSQMMMHGGDTANFHTTMTIFPEGKWGFVLLENAENYLSSSRIGDGVTALLMGKQPEVTQTDVGNKIIFAGIMGLFAIEIVGMLWSAFVLRRWQLNPARLPRYWAGRIWQIGVPFLLNLIVGLLFLVGLPVIFERTLAVIVLYIPDLGYTLIIGGIIALGWAVIWAIRTFFLLRSSPQPVLVP